MNTSIYLLLFKGLGGVAAIPYVLAEIESQDFLVFVQVNDVLSWVQVQDRFLYTDSQDVLGNVDDQDSFLFTQSGEAEDI